MDRLIEVKINGMHLTKDNNVAGVQYEANATVLRIEFDSGWDGYAKKVTFWNALGTNPVERTLTADLLEDLTKSTRIYLCPIPGEAMTEAGKCKFVVDGWVEGKRQRSIEDTLKVKAADFIAQADQPVDPTPTQAEQLQQQVDTLLGDIQKEAIRAETARTGAETAQGKAEAAQAAAETAKNGAETAQGKAEAAQAAAEKAKEGAEAAQKAAEAARDEAKTSETKAKASEAAAKTSETNAKASAEAAKSAAELAATDAAQKTDALLVDKVAAAREAEANAKASENAAKTSETNAKASETAAKTSETKAKDSEMAAKASETAAKTSESSAASSASSAASSKAAAETAQGKAEAAQAAAEKARNEAEGIVGGDYISRPEAKALVDQGVSSANNYTNRAIAAIPTPDVSGQIQAHDASHTAHGDIRQALAVHVNDAVKHITAEERTAWNGKANETDLSSHLANQNNPHNVTAEQVGAEPKGTADAKVSEHNTSEASHQDIRTAISGHLTNQNNPHNVTAEQVGAIAAGAVGNLHVWERVQTYADPVPEVPAGYTLGAVETDVLLVSKAGETSVSISYSDSISVDANGNVSLASVNTISYVISEWRKHYSVLQGKFCQVMDSTSDEITDAGASIFFFPSDAILEYAQAANYKLTLTAKKYQPVTGYPYTPAIPAGTTTDYLTSTDPNAYPKQSAEGGQDASYVLGDVLSGYLFASAWDGNASNYYYSETIKVSDTGTLTQENVKRYTANATNDSWVSNIQSAIRGKFITVSGETNNGGSEGTNLVYIPDDAIVSYFENGVSLGYPYNYGFLVNKMQQVTGYPAIPANTVITYLGQLGGGARIEVGSYVGTGTYGSSNPNSLTFGFAPKIVELLFRTSTNVGGNYSKYEDLTGNGFNKSQNFMVADRLTTNYVQGEGFGYNSYSSYGKKSPDRKTFYWYSSDAGAQCNRSEYVYYYIAIG